MQHRTKKQKIEPLPSKTWNAIEFFSGIGGLHYAFEQAFPESNESRQVVKAYDINQNANTVYRHNFHLPVTVRGIDVLKSPELDVLNANVWLLSPPCQPFTNGTYALILGGNRLDDQDVRSGGLLNLVKLLADLKTPPRVVFLENVKNFEESQSRVLLLRQLEKLGYVYDEFLLSPLHFGIPNDRKRYYLCAYLAKEPPIYTDHDFKDLSKIHTHPSTYIKDFKEIPMRPLKEYIQPLPTPCPEKYWVKAEDIRKRTGFIFDVVKEGSEKTSTFTKGTVCC